MLRKEYMKISPEQIAKCKQLFKEHFNKEITDEEAVYKIIQLVQIVQHVYKPLMED